MITEARAGHTWHGNKSGYRVRACAIGMPCACSASSQPQPAAQLATRSSKPTLLTRRELRQGFADRSQS